MPKIHPPPGPIARFFQGSIPADFAYAFWGLCLTVLGATQRLLANDHTTNLDKWFWVAIIIAGALQFAASAYRLVVNWNQASNKRQLHALEGALHTLHAMLIGTVEENERDPALRLTIHVPTADGNELIQVLNYIGNQRGGNKTAGRKFKATCGIIGRAYRHGEAYVASRLAEDYEEFIKELVSKWSYLEADARKINPATRSWMAIPLCSEDDKPAAAVVYADSTIAGFFDSEERQGIANDACQGIARFIELHCG